MYRYDFSSTDIKLKNFIYFKLNMLVTACFLEIFKF